MQYTLRNIPQALDRALRQRAREEGKSLNQVVLDTLIKALGLEGHSEKRRDLFDVVGTWEEDEAVEEALADQRRIDDELWR